MALLPTRRAVLEGERVRLRPLTPDDASLLAGWYADPEVVHWSHLSEDPPELQGVRPHRDRLERIVGNPRNVAWCIETREGDRPIGDVSLLDLHPHGRIELAITIGVKEFWSHGYGTEAVRLALRHAFGPLGCRRVYLITDRDNARAIRCYEKCGFVREGLLREHRLRDGKPLDMITMAVLKDEAILG
jgi:RimJ/RimL family protein N-acetyltransferase